MLSLFEITPREEKEEESVFVCLFVFLFVLRYVCIHEPSYQKLK